MNAWSFAAVSASLPLIPCVYRSSVIAIVLCPIRRMTSPGSTPAAIIVLA